MTETSYHTKKRFCKLYFILPVMVVYTFSVYSQSPAEKYIIKDGKMLIELSKRLNDAALDSFIAKFNLYDLDLKQFIQTASPDSIQKLGWKLGKSSRDQLVISKLLGGFDNFDDPADKIIFTEKKTSWSDIFPAVSTNIKYGYNRFKRKFSFLVKDSMVTFFLPGNKSAQKVMLAGSFNEWNPNILSMTHSDSGWIADVKLGPGKYWYTFIVDDHWQTDNDNATVEMDGDGNDNSVFYKSTFVFRLTGFIDAKKVFLSGSFNNWKPRELLMTKTASGWGLPLYLAEGTHTYRFMADEKWITDPENKDSLPNEMNGFNSVVKIGEPYTFVLKGYINAKQAVLTGSFNNFREDELLMTKISTGWEFPYTLGPGNYQYHFNVDGKPILRSDTVGGITKEQENTYLVIGANHTFRLKKFNGATSVFLAGDFNEWSPGTFKMKKDRDGWVLNVHLSKGKHVYKFMVDGDWITDPDNNLWEQNESGSGNSVIWFDE